MKSWLLQAQLLKGLSLLPAAHRLQYWFLQKNAFGKILPAAYYQPRLQLLRQHLEAAAKYGPAGKEKLRTLEIGTGLHLFTPIGFFLAGYNPVVCLDTKKLFTRHTLAQTLAVFREQELLGTLRNIIPDVVPERMQLVHQAHEQMKHMKMEEVLNMLQLELKQVRKFESLPFKTYHFDMVLSNHFLQELKVTTLMHALPELVRIVVPGAVFSHFIHLSDQFSYMDSSVSPFNYLQYTEEKWRKLTGKLTSQNRMRINFYRHLFTSSGLRIMEENSTRGKPDQLNSITLDLPFEGLKTEDVLVTESYLLALKQ